MAQNLGDNPEDDDEWETEEEDVYVVLNGLIDPSHLNGCTEENSKILGINTEKPIFKLNSYIFSGCFEDTLGTAVFFSRTDDRKKPSLQYFSQTCKQVNAGRAVLLPKDDGTVEVQSLETTETPGSSGQDQEIPMTDAKKQKVEKEKSSPLRDNDEHDSLNDAES